jgi:hypothetical protein
MGYRDELEAAQNRIAELEDRVREAEEAKAQPTPPPPDHPSQPSKRRRTTTFLGVPIGIALIAGSCAFGEPLCGRACGAASGETEPAMRALRACPKAREALGDDVGWGAYGCANCQGEGGGDPLNGGCHSTSDWQMPVSGARGRGSYEWSFTSPPGRPAVFHGGSVTTSTGERIVIEPDGCAR